MNVRPIVFATALLPCLALACSSAPGDENASSSDEALAFRPQPIPGAIVNAPPDHPKPPPHPLPPAPAFPPNNPEYCPAVDPQCSLAVVEEDTEGNAKLATMGCSPRMHWLTGYSAGWLGGNLTLCRDTPEVRAQFNPFQISAMNDACDACIPEAPPGTFYVLLESFVGPNCQSGCTMRQVGWGI